MQRFLFAIALTVITSNASNASGPKDPLEGFYGELTKATTSKTGREQVRIAWYGDSAIISDGYTGVVRERLQGRFGDAGPGFVLAAPTFEGYLRQGVRLKRQGWESNSVLSGALSSGLYGFGGVVATGMSGASATFEAKAPIKAFEIFYEKSAKGGRIEIIHGSAKAAAATVDTSGSGSDVYRYVPEGEASELKTLKIRAMGGAVRVYGVVLESADRGVQLDAIGILGIRARRWLNADAAHLKGQVAQRKPDLIVLNFGGNERVDPGLKKAAHVADLDKTLGVLKAGAPDAACLVIAPIAHGVEEAGKVVLDPALVTIYEAQREFAASAGCGFFDTLEAMGGKKALKSWRDKKLLSGDYAHLTTKGHQELGKLIADWLEAGYDNAKKGR
jgi:lysophospholipase L1-like esterase